MATKRDVHVVARLYVKDGHKNPDGVAKVVREHMEQAARTTIADLTGNNLDNGRVFSQVEIEDILKSIEDAKTQKQ